jgi:formylglycine-generating enzyme required for sulfatase activity
MTKEEALCKIKELEFYVENLDSKIKIDMIYVDLGENPFYMSKYLVTRELYKRITGETPSYFTGSLLLPVECVSYNDIVNTFLPALNKITGENYRLPTDYEWLLAALPIPENIEEYAVLNTNQTAPVGSKVPNDLGIYDLFGNVWEWTNTLYKKNNGFRVLRGGSWINAAAYGRMAYRDYGAPAGRRNAAGFRLVKMMK